MDNGYAMVRMPGGKILQLGRGAPKKVDIRVEFHKGNKSFDEAEGHGRVRS